MSDSVEGIAERIRKEYKQEAAEMGRTVPTCDTCLLENVCMGAQIAHHIRFCRKFIPKDWKSHIFFNGEWWS